MVFEKLTGLIIDSIPGKNTSLIDLPPDLISGIAGLVTILKAAGIIFIGYVVFIVIRWVLNFKRYRIVKKMNKKIDIIDKKLDILLGKKRLDELKLNDPVEKEHKKKRGVFGKLFDKKEKKKYNMNNNKKIKK